MADDFMIGIDLGTTNSLVAVVDGGIALVLADAEGRRLVPSVVHIPKNSSGGVLVGVPAKRSAHLAPATTFASMKRFMGRRSSEITAADQQNNAWQWELHGNAPAAVHTPHGPMLPEELAAEILKHLVSIANTRLDTQVTRAVITVPAYFNDSQRQATQRAGELAGLKVERIINEPTAAALAYGIDKLHTQAKIAVFDLGGGTFDISILQLQDGIFKVLSTSGDTQLGGDDIDNSIIHWIRGKIIELEPEFGFTPEIHQRIRSAAEEAKIRLSVDESAHLVFPFLTPDFSFECELSRAQLNDLARPTIRRTQSHCQRAMMDAGLEPTDLDQVILVGGQTRMPLVREWVNEVFGCREFEESHGSLRVGANPHKASGPRLNTSTNPDEAVALGAAIQAAILSGALKNVILMDVTPLSLGIETFGGLMNVIIPRNTTIPVKAGEMFTNALDYQKSMLIRILQGEREKAQDNWELGQLTIDFEPMLKATARVGVQFEIDSNGVLRVLARDTLTQVDKIVEIRSAVDVDDLAVQEMVESSVEHAFSDLAHRQWVEATLRAQQTLDAIRNGLTDYGDQLTDEETLSIKDNINQTLAILASGNTESGTGPLRDLKVALDSLDEASLPLADRMMEAISEQFLRDQGLIG
ncbi:MAG: Hsp70 family protein [Verrucomicrobia bacterium]|nr:Hsp70 family protein [Verrucomicrobiota bacterium]